MQNFLLDHSFHNDLSDIKPNIAISACLLGENVRYDGKSKHFPYIKEFFSNTCHLTSLCPEVGAGLGIPRPPIQIVTTDNRSSQKVVGVNDNNLDVTQPLSEHSNLIAEKHAGDFQAYILKSRSPSCGVHSTPIYNSNNEITNTGNGIYTQILSQQWKACIFIEEEDLLTTDKQQDLMIQCYLLLDIKLTPADKLSTMLKHYQNKLTDRCNNLTDELDRDELTKEGLIQTIIGTDNISRLFIKKD